MSVLFLSALVSPAEACGGFFCNNVPVEQGGEDILFGVGEDGEVTVHIQISYTGAANDFAWIVPVAQVPEILLSTDRLFNELAWRTQPYHQLETREVWECDNQYYNYPAAYDGAGYSVSSSADTGSRNTVVVVSTQNVGPYETVVLQAQTSEGLLQWLQENDYDLPNDLDPVLQPYIADGAYFVALKLQKDQDVGALQPIALRYPGTAASIPIQLTSIAATPDMRLHVYMLGQHRAVPDSYLHVKVNDIVVDWFSGGSNYEQAITVAADEAGGHAFATDFAGRSADVMSDVLWSEGRYDIAALAGAPDAYVFFDLLLQQGFVGDDQMLELFRTFLPMPAELVQQGVSEQDFYNCLRCYEQYVDAIPFDAPAFAAAIDERIVGPLREAQKLFDSLPALTRMTSSLSPAEMTVDPTFVFNPDMEQEISNVHTAILKYLCGFGGDAQTSPRELELPDGRTYELPSIEWFQEAGITEYEYLSDLMDNYALIIEDTSASGQPVVLTDHTEDEWKKAEAFNDLMSMQAAGCGCDGVGGGSAFAGAALAGLLVRRRRS